MQGKTVIITQNPFFVVFPSGILTFNHVLQLSIVLILGEILPAPDGRGIVTVHLVEEQVAVLEAPDVYGYQGDTGAEAGFVLAEQSVSIGDAGEYDIGRCNHFRNVIHHLERYIAVSGKPLHEKICLILSRGRKNIPTP